jgi:hypothetical protein
MNHVTQYTPVKLWWCGHGEAELQQSLDLAQQTGDKVYRPTEPHLAKDVYVETTVRRAVLDWGEQTHELAQYFDEAEFPELEQDLDAIHTELWPEIKKRWADENVPRKRPLVPKLSVAEAKAIQGVVQMYFEDERASYQGYQNVDFTKNPELEDPDKMVQGHIYTHLLRLHRWLHR